MQAKLIEFHPTRSTDVKLPREAVFVVSNSCVEINKAATSNFNMRVAESRLAAQVMLHIITFILDLWSCFNWSLS